MPQNDASPNDASPNEASPNAAGPDTAARDRRNKLFGRLAVVGLLLLIAVYLAPMFLSLMK